MKRPSKLSDSLHQRLNSYALAASAAGVSLLALTPPAEYMLPAGGVLAGALVLSEPAEGKIVYTPDNRWLSQGYRYRHKCTENDTLRLDLNHDGNTDFTLCSWWAKSSAALSVWPGVPNHRRPSNMIAGVESCWKSIGGHSACGYVARRLQYGYKIGPTAKWTRGIKPMKTCSWFATGGSSVFCHGTWSEKKGEDAYLGLKFQIKGKPHYGWEHVVFAAHRSSGSVQLHSVGYAYETIPNKPIVAGKIKGPGSLGQLARGASAIEAWRQKEQ